MKVLHEVEITRRNVTVNEFYSYAKQQFNKKAINLTDWITKEDFINPEYKTNKATEKEVNKVLPCEIQFYYKDNYNFIMEYDNENKIGYLYLIQYDNLEEIKEEINELKEVKKESNNNKIFEGCKGCNYENICNELIYCCSCTAITDYQKATRKNSKTIIKEEIKKIIQYRKIKMKKVKRVINKPSKKKPISEKIKGIKTNEGVIKLNDMIIIPVKNDF